METQRKIEQNQQEASEANEISLSDLAAGRSYLAVFQGPRHEFQEVVQYIRTHAESQEVELLNARLSVPFRVPVQAFLPNSPARISFQLIDQVEFNIEDLSLEDLC